MKTEQRLGVTDRQTDRQADRNTETEQRLDLVRSTTDELLSHTHTHTSEAAVVIWSSSSVHAKTF